MEQQNDDQQTIFTIGPGSQRPFSGLQCKFQSIRCGRCGRFGGETWPAFLKEKAPSGMGGMHFAIHRIGTPGISAFGKGGMHFAIHCLYRDA